jgi:hypothetical protein
MKLYSVTGMNASGKGLWTHIFPDDATMQPSIGRIFVHSPSAGDYWLDDAGNMEAHHSYVKRIHQDDD